MFDDFNKRLEGEEKGQQTTWWPGFIKDKSKRYWKKKMWRAFLALPLLSTLSSTMNWRERKIVKVRGAHGRDPFS